jgi:NADH dehydrogenase
MGGIIEGQRGHVLGFINAYALNPLLFPIAVMFLISAMAETARAPFDLTEAESELVAGYQTEYSSMAFALFWLGEYANVLLMCALNAILFWGGWLPPVDWAPLYMVPGIIWFFAKILVMFFIFAWVKATVPRYRYDQLMRLGWKIFLPISLFWVFLVSGYLMSTGHWNKSPRTALEQNIPISLTKLAHTCDLEGDVRKLELIVTVPEKPAYQEYLWQAKFDDAAFNDAEKFEFASKADSSLGLRWNESGRSIAAYLEFGDLPKPDGSQDMWGRVVENGNSNFEIADCTTREITGQV